MTGYGEVISPPLFFFFCSIHVKSFNKRASSLALCYIASISRQQRPELRKPRQTDKNLQLKIGFGRSSKTRKFVFFSSLFSIWTFLLKIFFFCGRFVLFHYLPAENYCAMARRTACSRYEKHMSMEILHLILGFQWGEGRRLVDRASMNSRCVSEKAMKKKNCTRKYLLGWGKNTKIRCKNTQIRERETNHWNSRKQRERQSVYSRVGQPWNWTFK